MKDSMEIRPALLVLVVRAVVTRLPQELLQTKVAFLLAVLIGGRRQTFDHLPDKGVYLVVFRFRYGLHPALPVLFPVAFAVQERTMSLTTNLLR